MNIGGVNNKINLNGIVTVNKPKTVQTDEGVLEESASSPVKRKKKSEADKLEEMRNMYQDVMRQLETANAQAKAQSDAMEKQRKCLLIAMRIMCGDKVPPEDHKYLVENDPGLYGKAILMRMQKKDPEEYERLSEDDEDGVEASDGSGSSSSGEAVQSGGDSGGEVQAEASGEPAESSE